MRDILPSLGVIALGAITLWIWAAARISPRFWKRRMDAFDSVTSRAFARGFGGGSFLIGLGLVSWGLGGLVIGWVNGGQSSSAPPRAVAAPLIALSLGGMFICIVAGFVVTWLGRPKWFFPADVRDMPAPWREAIADRRKRRSGNP